MTRRTLNASTSRALYGLLSFAHRHHRSLVAGAAVLLTGFGITAVAVAPLAPDAAALPKRMVSEAVVPEGIDAQLLALATQELSLTRSDITRGTDTAEALFSRLGISDATAVSFIRSDATARLLLTGRGGKMVRAQTDSNGALQQLVARYQVFKELLPEELILM